MDYVNPWNNELQIQYKALLLNNKLINKTAPSRNPTP